MPVSPISSTNPPTPSYIFRYHNNPIHALQFFQRNNFFASGDSSGLLVIWRLTTRRPVSAFQAHDGGIMGIKDWEGGKLITHGRDHKLRVWQIKITDLEGSVKGPVRMAASGDQNGEGGESEGRKPWLLHSMSVNALNFCAFSICDLPEYRSEAEIVITTEQQCEPDTTDTSTEGQTNIQTQTETSADVKSTSPSLLIAAPNGLDSGGIDIFQLPSEHRISQIRSSKDSKAGMVMALSLSYDANADRFLLVAGFEDGSVDVHEVVNGSKLSATWMWTRVLTSRPHSQPTLSVDVTPDHAAFITSSADANIARFMMPANTDVEFSIIKPSEPEKVQNTKHAGQQDLKIRSDGKIFATAGWDGRVRVYSVKTLKELAVLQWHKEGCYAVAFAEVVGEDADGRQESRNEDQSVAKMNNMDRMKHERDRKVHNTHWLVGGSKDGKISLWDVY